MKPETVGAAATVAVPGPAGPEGKSVSVVGPAGVQGVEGPAGRSIIGPTGERGPRGERGESVEGKQGPSSVFVVEEKVTELQELYVGQRLSAAATCPSGSTPIGGGGFRSEPEDIGVVTGDGPDEDNGWATVIEVTRPPAFPIKTTFLVWANCVR
jgi:hypothetical protein